MPKFIDSIGARPEKESDKSVVMEKTGRFARGRKAYHDSISSHPHPESKNGSSPTSNTPRAGRDKQKWFIAGIALAAVIGLGFLVVRYLPGGAGNYAYVGGNNGDIKVSKKLTKDLKDSLQQQAEKENLKNYDAVTETEKKVALWVALQDQSRKLGQSCSDEDIEQYLRSNRKIITTLDDYYAVNLEKAGRTKEVVQFQDQIDCLKLKLGDNLITKREYSALTIRWDYFKEANNGTTDQAAETKIKQRFETDFLPLYKQSASKEAIAAKSDSNYQMNSDQQRQVDLRDDGYLSSFNLYQNLLSSRTSGGFAAYADEGESNYTYLEKLNNAGDYTPIFKSSTGYYAIFRLESVTGGAFDSYEAMLDNYRKDIKLSLDVQIQRASAQLFGMIRSVVVQVAQAAQDCLLGTSHRIRYYVRVEDSQTGQAINGVKLRAVTDRKNTVCNPVNGNFAGDQTGTSSGSLVGPNWYNQTVEDTIENNQDVFGFVSDEFQLDCNGAAWRFLPDVATLPAGYQFTNAPGSVYGCHESIYFCNLMAINHGSAFGVPFFDVPYSRGVNGDFFTLVIKLERVAPVEPKITFQGYKVNELNDGSGPYANAAVKIDGSGAYTSDQSGVLNAGAQPYFIRNILAGQNHVIAPDPVPGFAVAGYKLGGPNSPVVPASQYTYAANTYGDGTVINLWWVYRPIISGNLAMSCGTITGNATGPAGLTLILTIDGTEVARGSGSTLSYAVADQYRDGASRTARLYAEYMGQNFPVLDTKVHGCSSNAICASDFGSNVATSFPGNVASLAVGDTQQIKVTMTNTGESIWSNYASYGRYQLTLTAAADVYWDLSGNTMSGLVRPIDGQRDVSFMTTIKLTRQPDAAATPLAFQMNFVPNSGAPVLFGTACSTNLRIESRYAPWLRVQNGSTAARQAITGQPSSARGMRDTAGTNQSLNLETTYAVTSIVSANNFCSTNAYNYGRQATNLTWNGVPGGVVTNCSSGSYPFTISPVFDGPAESLYTNAESLRSNNGACLTAPDALKPDTRYKDGGLTGATGAISAVAGCPTIYALNGTALGSRTITKGRVTITVDGDLTITGNLTADYASALAGGLTIAPTLTNGDVAAMVAQQNAALSTIPTLGIVVKGNVTIDKSVDRIDAMIYAGGKINTCSDYPGSSTGKQTAAVASQCARRLTVRGGLYALNGFYFGRNWFDVGRIVARTGVPVASTAFDYIAPGADSPQGPYSGGPAEDVIGTGFSIVNTPPGFEDINSSKFNNAIYQDGSFAPRF